MSKKTKTTTTTVTTVTEETVSNNKALETIVAVVIDESGSMGGREDQVVSSINEYIEGLKKLDSKENRYKITLTQFANESEVVYANRPIAEYTPISKHSYKPHGSTALNDAIGDTIKSIEKETKGRSECAVLMIILTDGDENSSCRYNTSQIREIISGKEKSEEWTFVYLGADQDSFANSQAYGFRAGNVMNFSADNYADSTIFLSKMTNNYNKMRSKGVGATSMASVVADSADLMSEELKQMNKNAD